ncbi:hypothetical protein PQR12_36370 [Paraburkholderia nemoris]|uniref:hypothetical protein n=1 Tax=Paraburkholderia nemoris TaxID=2793076 RepID=UPI0038B7ADB8
MEVLKSASLDHDWYRPSCARADWDFRGELRNQNLSSAFRRRHTQLRILAAMISSY